MNGDREALRIEEQSGDVLLVTLDRPEVANAFNTGAALELCELFERFRDEQPCRCVVVTGAGDRAFCAGADLKERESLSDEQWHSQHEVFERMFRAVRDCPIPVIAAVNGAAYGGGLELVLLCDFAYASRTAKFALTEVSLGIMPGGGGTQTLPRAVGERRATQLILAARPFSAEEALAWGVVNKLCEAGKVGGGTVQEGGSIPPPWPLSRGQGKAADPPDLQQDPAFAPGAGTRAR